MQQSKCLSTGITFLLTIILLYSAVGNCYFSNVHIINTKNCTHVVDKTYQAKIKFSAPYEKCTLFSCYKHNLEFTIYAKDFRGKNVILSFDKIELRPIDYTKKEYFRTATINNSLQVNSTNSVKANMENVSVIIDPNNTMEIIFTFKYEKGHSDGMLVVTIVSEKGTEIPRISTQSVFNCKDVSKQLLSFLDKKSRSLLSITSKGSSPSVAARHQISLENELEDNYKKKAAKYNILTNLYSSYDKQLLALQDDIKE